MSISGISGGGYGYGYSSSINNLLQLSSLKSTASYSAISAVNRVSSTNKNTSAYASVTSFLKDYQSELTGLEAAAAKLQTSVSGNVFTELEAGSTDEAVATAQRSWRLEAGLDVDLEVHAVAQSQRNVSVANLATDQAEEDMEFEIAGPGGNQTISISSTNANGTKKTYKQMYQEAAKAVNANSKTGVKASVEGENGKVSLVLTGKNTGEANSFSVYGKTGAAAGLEYIDRAASDASYTVTQNGYSQSYTSDTNKVSIAYGRVDVELKKEGSTNIYSGVDTDRITDAVQDLVDSYNSVTNLLEANSGRGRGTAAHLTSFQRGMAHEKTLAALGITTNKAGDLVLDKEKLTEALEKDYDFVVDTLGGQFGLAEKAAEKADRALSDSVQRIVSNDLGGNTSSSSGSGGSAGSAASAGNAYTQFANFVSGGAYNLANYYAVGMLLNTMA
ncbi:MAG: flagellar filament capping protein FliD [Lachnospiraceae bacterium]|nr:flagellar filament capping protein FliD [Lachnospiraceae bacterium]